MVKVALLGDIKFGNVGPKKTRLFDVFTFLYLTKQHLNSKAFYDTVTQFYYGYTFLSGNFLITSFSAELYSPTLPSFMSPRR